LVETIAVLTRRQRRGDISRTDCEAARFRLALDHSTGRVGIIDVEHRHIVSEHDLILRHPLSGTDAVILACALDLKDVSPIFVCADTRSGLLRAAEACGLSTLNPLSPHL
jgi:predicted nucleic acid-binding protein